MNLGLLKKVAFVAGASSGLGYAIARSLLQEGCRVAICSRSQDRISQAGEALCTEAGVPQEHVLPLTCDVRNEASIQKAMQQTVDTLGSLHVLVTNAGGPPSGPIGSFDASAWHAALELNLLSTINLCRHALPFLREAADRDGHARILMVTSVSAKQPVPGLALSNVSRAGVQAYMKSLAADVGPHGITVNTVLPGYTRTERLTELAERIQQDTGQTREAIEAGWASNNVLNRLGTPDEFAAMVTFLASKQASFITGTAALVDGGHVKHLL